MDGTFSELVSAAVKAAAGRESALTDGRRSVPFAALAGHVASLDRLFAVRGISPGAVLALEATSSVAGALTLLAVLARGLSVVLSPPDRGAPRSALPSCCRHRVTVRSELTDGARIALDDPESFLDISENAAFDPPPGAESLASGKVLLRTSGSIGTPKLVVYSHGRLLANALLVVGRLRLAADDRVLLPVPLTHMFGLGAGFLPALAVGASIDLVEGANLPRYVEHERRFEPTVAFLTPALCFMIARQKSAPSHYRHIVVAGDKLQPATFEAAERRFRRVVNLYGCTELGVISAADPAAAGAGRDTTAGAPLPGVEVRIEAPRDAADAAPGAGSIACRHPYGFDGYASGDGGPWTGDPPPSDGFHRPRDLVRVHAGGALEVLGREDHSVNRDGRLVLLADVERAMESLPGVERAVTVLGEDGLRGRRISAFCVARDGHALDGDAIRAACAAVLPAYAIPDQVRLTASVPLLPSGKIDRRALAALAAPNDPARGASA